LKISFSKMHGLGNDYVYVNCLAQSIKDPEGFSKFASDRHFGIGSDGLILILPSEVADFKMRMFNSDGSEGKMCGNGIRCVGKYVYEKGLTGSTVISVETLGGIKYLYLNVENGKVVSVEVDMGKAIIKPCCIPVLSSAESFISQPLQICGKSYMVTCVSMGNPHCVVFCGDICNLDNLNIEKLGPEFENCSLFPEKINTEFVEIIDKNSIKMRVWERGSGETFACGTGACASVVACVLNSFADYDQQITVKLKCGELYITYKKDGTVFMKGTATHVFDGVIEYNFKEDN